VSLSDSVCIKFNINHDDHHEPYVSIEAIFNVIQIHEQRQNCCTLINLLY